MKPGPTRALQAAVALAQRAQALFAPQLLKGPGCLLDLPGLLASRSCTRALIVTTEGFVRRGAVSPLEKRLDEAGIAHELFTGVVPDPDFACVEAAAEAHRSSSSDAIIALGGGSVIDCAKAAGACIVRPDAPVGKLVGTLRVRRRIPLTAAVPTTAGTGSETTAAAVLTDRATQRKYAMSDFSLIPQIAVLDPELLAGLSPEMTAWSGMDALTHAVEAYINRFASALARQRAQRAVRAIFSALKGSYDDGSDLALRAAMLGASFDAGVAFSNAFVGYAHAIAHGVGGLYHTQHGLANAIILPYVLEEFVSAAQKRLTELDAIVSPEGTPSAERFIGRVRGLAASLGIPETLDAIRNEDVSMLARGAEREGNPAYPVPEIWTVSRFERVIRRIGGLEARPDRARRILYSTIAR